MAPKGPIGSIGRLVALLVTAGAFGLLAAPAAEAETVTIGSPLEGMTAGSVAHVFTLVNGLLPEPRAMVASPIDGTVVRWRITQSSGGPFRLRVLRPGAGGTYTAVGTSAPMTPVDLTTQTFATNLPIRAGEVVGLDTSALSDKVGLAYPTGAETLAWTPPLAEGATLAPTNSQSQLEIGFNADVQPAPALASMFPTSGPAGGGTSVTISGHDFSGATAVMFGSTPASSYKVESDYQITATSPAGSGTVDIVVITPGGQTPAVPASKFTFVAPPAPPAPVEAHCVVPNLVGKTLKASRKALKKADCALGKVRGSKAKSARVKKQAPKPGTVRAAGAKVNVTLKGAGRHA